jgi:uncharacterized protein YbjQ (UPF0145 family)
MPEHGRQEGQSESEEQRDAESVAALEHGALPVTAVRRIEEAEQHGGTWASDFSVAEFTAVEHLGFHPVGLVLGSSTYHIALNWGGQQRGGGIAPAPGGRGAYIVNYPCPHGYYHDGQRTGFNFEQTSFEQGIITARNLAMSRMVAEATALGAHGVVGVRLHFRRPGGTAGTVEFTVVGTAVRREGVPLLAEPFTSHLSGQEFAKLLRTGYVPAAFVIGVGAIQIYPGCGMEFQESSWYNQELQQLTDAAQAARSIAVAHIEREAALVGDGVIGVDVHLAEHEGGASGHLVELQAFGTAVRRFADEPLPEAPLAMLRVGRT